MASPASLTWAEVCGRRLQRHGLAEPLPGEDPADAAAAMCGAHAQVMSAAELSVALRMAAGTCAGVRAALWDTPTLVKTFGPRGTVHLLPARDLARWCGALSALPPSRNLPEASARLVFPGRAGERALSRGQAGNMPVLLVAGVAAGVWQLRRSGRRASVTVEPVVRVTAALRRAVEAEANRLGDALGAVVEARIGRVTVGPHA